MILPNLVVYIGNDVGYSRVLYLTTNDREGREAWEKFKTEIDCRFHEIIKLPVKNADLRLIEILSKL